MPILKLNILILVPPKQNGFTYPAIMIGQINVSKDLYSQTMSITLTMMKSLGSSA